MNATAAGSAVEYDDVQGIVRFGYKHLTEARYLLLRVADARAARAWLGAAPVATSATATTLPDTALHVAFTAEGLRALDVPEEVVGAFSAEFVSGIAGHESRSRRLGDVGGNAPVHWIWGVGGGEPHVLVALFAAPGKVDALASSLRGEPWNAAFAQIACLDTSDLGGVEPFGFTDGISQPAIDWECVRPLRGNKPRYGNLVAIGEFLLGYPNEYDCYTERPLVDPGGAAALLPPAAEDSSRRDVGRNGTYLVLRDLRQDVRGFWSFAQSDDLASAFVGRRRNGDPLVPPATAPIEGSGKTTPGTPENNFTYAGDPQGVLCPFGAHIRRANPRTGDFPTVPSGPIATAAAMLGLAGSAFHDDLTSSVRFHRILRRGREYGSGLSPQEARAPAPAGEPPRGLRFVCLNANIARQFEFLQNAWISNDSFDGLIGESDPLLGDREPAPGGRATDSFVANRKDAARRRIAGLPRFVTVTGGAYFFLPGLRSLRYLLSFGTEGAK
jgi:deferrochelatase/peroxidase EfeB